MALSTNARNKLARALPLSTAADEIADAIDAVTDNVAANILALGSTANLAALVPTASSLAAVTGVYSNAAEPTGVEVDAAVNALGDLVDTALDLKADNADVETLRTQVEARLDAIEAKVDALLAALKTAGLMLPNP